MRELLQRPELGVIEMVHQHIPATMTSLQPQSRLQTRPITFAKLAQWPPIWVGSNYVEMSLDIFKTLLKTHLQSKCLMIDFLSVFNHLFLPTRLCNSTFLFNVPLLISKLCNLYFCFCFVTLFVCFMLLGISLVLDRWRFISFNYYYYYYYYYYYKGYTLQRENNCV